MERWCGKVAVVTGASSGIGRATTSTLVKCGLNVIGVARRQEKLYELESELKDELGKLFPLKVDMTIEEEIMEIFSFAKEKFGGVDILINNAGISLPSSLIDGKSEDWRKVFDTNVIGLCIATREAAKSMTDRDVDGHIIHISSLLGHKIPSPVAHYLSVYPATKFGVQSLADVLHHEMVARGKKIKITTVSPSLTDTEIIKDECVHEEVRPFVALLPKISSQDVADVIKYVLSTPPHLLIQDIVVSHVLDAN